MLTKRFKIRIMSYNFLQCFSLIQLNLTLQWGIKGDFGQISAKLKSKYFGLNFVSQTSEMTFQTLIL